MARARATDSQKLIRAAARVFRSKGYHNATIDDIAVSARVSRQTVYRYTKSKRFLLDCIVQEVLDDLAARLEADLHAGRTPYDHLHAVITTHVESAVENRTFYAIVFSEEAELSPKMRKQFRDWAHHTTLDFQKLLERCLNTDGITAGLDPTIAANLIVTMLTSIHRWYDPKGPVKPDQLADQILTIIGGILDRTPAGAIAVPTA